MTPTDTREKILYKAFEYFSNNDYEKTSLNNIAENLGVTRGAIYHYFKSKEDLFRETFLTVLKDIRTVDEERKRNEPDYWSFLRHAMSLEIVDQVGHMDMLRNDPDFLTNFAYLMMIAIKKFPDVKQLYKENSKNFFEETLDKTRKAQREGIIRDDIDPEALAFEIVSVSTGIPLFCGVHGNLEPARLGNKTFTEIWNRIKK